MTYATINLKREGHKSIVTVCDWCGTVLNGIGTPVLNRYVTYDGFHLCEGECNLHAAQLMAVKPESSEALTDFSQALAEMERSFEKAAHVISAAAKAFKDK